MMLIHVQLKSQFISSIKLTNIDASVYGWEEMLMQRNLLRRPGSWLLDRSPKEG
jgi:hypothetical protein